MDLNGSGWIEEADFQEDRMWMVGMVGREKGETLQLAEVEKSKKMWSRSRAARPISLC